MSLPMISDRASELSPAEVELLERAMRHGMRGFVLAEFWPARALFVVSAMEACGWVRFVRLRKRTRVVVTASGRAVWRWYVRREAPSARRVVPIRPVAKGDRADGGEGWVLRSP